jgi:glycosyltransferase involved in cell wall biosynthesis
VTLDPQTPETSTAQDGCAVFADLNTIARENFTSGLLIIVRDYLRGLERRGQPASVLSLSSRQEAFDYPRARPGFRRRSLQGIPVNETLVDYNILSENLDETARLARTEFERLQPRTIIMNSPAVFLTEAHLVLLEAALATGISPKYFVCDGLFPSETASNKALRDRYLSLVRQTEIVAVSELFQKEFGCIARKAVDFLPTPFDKKSIVGSANSLERRFITLVNHHPLKGREVFNAVAHLMPDKDFLVVETWPDVPAYIPPFSNITFARFYDDVRALWNQTRILLVPSLWSEGRARVVTEAMLNGIPVLAHAIGSLPELAGEGLIFIDPPPVDGYELVGTVLFPRIASSHVTGAAQRFADQIAKIESAQSKWDRLSELARATGETYFSKMDKHFNELCDAWCGTREF